MALATFPAWSEYGTGANSVYKTRDNYPLEIRPTRLLPGNLIRTLYQDFVAVNRESNSVSIYLGKWKWISTQSAIPVGNSPTSAVIKDFTNDEIPDIAVCNSLGIL